MYFAREAGGGPSNTGFAATCFDISAVSRFMTSLVILSISSFWSISTSNLFP